MKNRALLEQVNISLVLRFFIFVLIVFNLQTVHAQNGKIIERHQLDYLKNKDLASRITTKVNGKSVLKPRYKFLEEVSIEEITYLSDGLKVKGYLASPLTTSKYPCVIYNRGGNKDFGALNEYKAVFILARMASWGYVVAASQYRGNMGGEGKEEFGGKDVNDVLHLIPFLGSLPNADTTQMAIYGWSRGGMMAYLTLTKTCQFKAAIVGAGVTDLWAWMETRQDTIESVFAENIPNYAYHTKSSLDARSAIKQVDKICKTTPILILHGTDDWRVDPGMVLDLSKEFIQQHQPHRLIMYEGGNHSLSNHRKEVNMAVKAWLEKYVGEGK